MFKDSFHFMESGFCISNTYHRSIFDPRSLLFERHARPTSELQTKFYCSGARGAADRKPRGVRADLYRTLCQRQSPPCPTSRSLDNFGLGALTGSSRASEEGFPQGRACFEDDRSFPMRYLFGYAIRAKITKRLGWHTLRLTSGTLLKSNGKDMA